MATIQEGIDELRGASSPQRTLNLGGGSYVLEKPVVLNAEDSGLVIEGGGASVRCGCVLTNWADDADGLLAARVPEGADPAMLLIGGRARPRARYPETGALTYRSTTDVKWMNSTNGGWNRPLTHEELTRVVVNPADFPKNMDVRNAEITVFHEWDESTVRVRSLDRKTGLVELESELEHPAGSFGKREYVLWNVREGMTRPGQWYFDRTRGLIVYRPMSGESADNLDAEIPVSLHAFLLKGARNVVIRNLNIRCVNTHHEKSGLRAVNCPGAIEGTDCENVLIDGVRLSDVAGTGIKFLRSREIDVRHCRISDCGAGGIFEMEVMPARVSGNLIERIGQSVFSAVGIHAGGKSQLVFVMDGCRAESGGVAVSGNTITDAPYCAITCGGGPHIVERNRIRRCMTVLHDGAAIYCSRGRRTVIRGNYVSEISGRAAHACYFDEMSSLCACEGNVFIDIENVVNNHLSSHCVYRNNFFFCHGTMRVALPRSAHFLFEENIFAATEAVCFESSFMANEIRWDFEDVLQLRANLVWAPVGVRYRSSLNYGERPLYDGEFPPNPGVIRLNPNVTYTPEGAPVVAEDSPLRWLGVSAPDVHEAGAHE